MRKNHLYLISLFVGLVFSSPAMSNEKTGSVDIDKFCLGEFCLGDSASKFGGLKKFKEFPLGAPFSMLNNMKLKTIAPPKVPDCDNESIHAILANQNIKKDSKGYIRVKFSGFPEYAANGVDEYFRISEIYANFLPISDEAQKQLPGNVFGRAGASGKEVVINSMYPNSPQYKFKPSRLFGGIPVHSIDLRVFDTLAHLQLNFGNHYNYTKLLKNQSGCLNSAPKL